MLFRSNRYTSDNLDFNYQFNLCRSLNTTWHLSTDAILKHFDLINKSTGNIYKKSKNGEMKLVGKYKIEFDVKKENIFMIMI